jgi:hypothetical protein
MITDFGTQSYGNVWVLFIAVREFLRTSLINLIYILITIIINIISLV